MAVPEPQASGQVLMEALPKDSIKTAAARLYAMGFSRPVIAGRLGKALWPEKPARERMRRARRKLRDWEFDQDFRDMIYDGTLVKLDLQTPDMFEGLLGAAMRGRVDAIRLALELTGRHNPKGEVGPTNVLIQFPEMPRPIHQPLGPAVVEIEAASDEPS